MKRLGKYRKKLIKWDGDNIEVARGQQEYHTVESY